MHVQFLLFFGAVRNYWINDPLVKGLLLSQVPPRILHDVERYQSKLTSSPARSKGKAKEETADPGLVKTLGVLMHWWKKRFNITAPGIRKTGYKPMWVFENERTAEGRKVLFTTGRRDQDGEEMFTPFLDRGETVKGVEGMRALAASCQGSRDVGAMLFTGLCRALGFEARLVYSLQPLGFGFSSAEENEDNRTPGKAADKEMEFPIKKRTKIESKSEESDSDSDLTSLSSDSEGEPVVKSATSPSCFAGWSADCL
jgi:xeroderma pigmentosum group C-complementing protein